MEVGMWEIALIFTKFCLYASCFMAIGSGLFLLIFGETNFNIKVTIYFSSAIAAISSVVFILVQTGYIMDDGFAGMLDTEMLQIFLDEKIGTSLYMRIAGLGLLVLLVLMSQSLKWLMILPILMVASSFALVGHASGDDFIYTASLLALHLVAVSFWLGALMPLYFSAEQDYSLEMLEKFGNIAAFIVPVLLIVGLLFAIYIVGGFAALFRSSYGIALLIKVAVVGVLLGLATLNKIYLVPQIAAKQPLAINRLKWVIRIEALAFAAIFVATAILTTSVELPE